MSLSQSLAYPPETALFKALPRLCMSSPMPRTVAHPSKAKTTKLRLRHQKQCREKQRLLFHFTSRAVTNEAGTMVFSFPPTRSLSIQFAQLEQ